MLIDMNVKISQNPFLKEYENITHQMLLYHRDKDLFDRYKQAAVEPNKIYEEKQRQLRLEEARKQIEMKNERARRRRRLKR